MNEERRRILEMVADGTITPSEGARLLEALGSSGFGREKPSTPRRRSIIDAGAMLSEIGPMVQETMGEIFRGTRKSDMIEGIDFEESDSFEAPLEQGTDIVITGSMKKGAGISVFLTASEDDLIRAEVDGGGTVLHGEKNGKLFLSWKEGAIRVQLPETAGSVKVVSRGGSIHSEGIRIPVSMNTMGGGITIVRPGASFSAKTMGGKLEMLIDEAWNGNSKAKSMGGGVAVTLDGPVGVLIEASTLGGTIDPGDLEHQVVSTSGGKRGGSKMSIAYGGSEEAPRLAVSTMGGDIMIKGGN
ncbi:MAG TPA: hypothetical protein PK907_02230 [Candidatus Sabulitectum sp.]|nr:hypothetical protein [Candidatus Sabulitectum sp.]